MVTPRDAERLIEILEPLCGPLYSALDRAAEIAAAHFDEYGMADPEFGVGQAHLARAHARRLMTRSASAGEFEPWSLAKPGPNLQLVLRHAGMLTLKLLRPFEDQAPPTGTNRARIAYYTHLHDNLFGVDGSDLIGLWRPDKDGEVSVRVVRTRGPVRFGRSMKCDLDLMLPRAADDLEQLEFRPAEGELEFRLPFEDEQDRGDEAGEARG